MLYTKFQKNIPCDSGEKIDFNGLAIFSNSHHFGFSNRLNFISLKHGSLVMLRKLRTTDAVVLENKSFQWT